MYEKSENYNLRKFAFELLFLSPAVLRVERNTVTQLSRLLAPETLLLCPAQTKFCPVFSISQALNQWNPPGVCLGIS